MAARARLPLAPGACMAAERGCGSPGLSSGPAAAERGGMAAVAPSRRWGPVRSAPPPAPRWPRRSRGRRQGPGSACGVAAGRGPRSGPSRLCLCPSPPSSGPPRWRPGGVGDRRAWPCRPGRGVSGARLLCREGRSESFHSEALTLKAASETLRSSFPFPAVLSAVVK